MTFEHYKLRFAEMDDAHVVRCFNNEVGNPGWTSSRANYLSAMHQEIENRNWDYSEIGDNTGLSFRKEVHLVGKKLWVFCEN